jgi:hypothetical protein
MPRHLRTGRLAILCMLVIGCMVAAAAPAGATAATGHARVPVKIETSGQFTGPDTVSGTFTLRVGRIKDSGTYTETFTIVGDVIDAVKVLTGSRGTLVIGVHTFIDLPTPTTPTFHGGRWRILSGTGAYCGLQGGGRPGAIGGGDLAAGTTEVSHRGTARLG